MPQGSKLAPVWLVAIVGLILLGGAAGLVVIAAENRGDDDGRRPGTVTVSGCTWLHDNLHGGATYSCIGSFTAADESFTVPVVTIDHEGNLPEGATIGAKAAGPKATVAIENHEVWYRFWVPLVLGILLAGLVAFAFRSWLRARLKERRAA